MHQEAVLIGSTLSASGIDPEVEDVESNFIKRVVVAHDPPDVAYHFDYTPDGHGDGESNEAARKSGLQQEANQREGE